MRDASPPRSTVEMTTSQTRFLRLLLMTIPVSGSLLYSLFFYPIEIPDSMITRTARGGYLAMLGLSWILAFLFLGSKRQTYRLLQSLQQRFRDVKMQNRIALLAICAFLTGGSAFLLPTYSTGSLLAPYLLRLSPLSAWLACLGIILLVLGQTLREDKGGSDQVRTHILSYLVSFSFLLLMTLFVALSIDAQTPSLTLTNTTIGRPGVPILTSQLVLVVLIAIPGSAALWLYSEIFAKRFRSSRGSVYIDPAIASIVWIIAVVVWMNTPIGDNFFIGEKRLPNREVYPYSDAALHDIHAQNLLVGEGLTRGSRLIVRRPLYSLLLAIDHMIVGQDYEKVVALQIFALASFPVILYLLATRLNNRISGILAAGLVIFREKNAISLAGVIDVSNSKMLMSDMPTALAVCLFTLVLVLYLEAPSQRKILPLVLGGILGLTMLVRIQVVLLSLIPLGFIVSKALGTRDWKTARIAGSTLLAGMLLTLMPWIFRNYSRTGSFAIESTSQLRLIAERLTADPAAFDPSMFPGESETEFGQRMVRGAVEQFLNQPLVVLESVQKNYAYNLYTSALFLPTSTLSSELDHFVREAGYWHKWDGSLRADTILPLSLNLVVMGIGLGAVYSRRRQSGIAPLFVFLVFSLTTALVGASGWRFILPADWVLILYFSAGIGLAAPKWLSPAPPTRLSNGHSEFIRDESKLQHDADFRSRGIWLTAGLFFFLGALLPLSEMTISPRYGVQSAEEIRITLNQTSNYHTLPHAPRQTFEDLLLSADNAAHWGRAIYPGYYAPGDGEPGGDWPSFNVRSCARIGFLILGPEYLDVILPVGSGEIVFPNGADALVVGREVGNVFQAQAVLLLFEDRAVLHVSSQPEIPCLQ